MKESREVEIKPEESKDSQEVSMSTSVNITERPLAPQPQAETIEIKPKVQQSKFEYFLVNAFKELVGFIDPKDKAKAQIPKTERLRKKHL